jgi:hypothetical protein
MPNPMYKHPMPTERLKDKIAELEKIIDEQTVKIAELEQRDAILTALEAGGVDNWEGYELSLNEME